MTARKEFEMSKADFDGILAKIKEARNTPLIALQCGMPQSDLEAANQAWCELGKRLGFEGMSVRPIEGKGQLFFTAEATEVALSDAKPKIVTRHVYPPIPIRDFDWCAHREGEEEAGNYGWGRTEEEAINRFLVIEEEAAMDGA